jgi:hypothetical protein
MNFHNSAALKKIRVKRGTSKHIKKKEKGLPGCPDRPPLN